MFTKYFLPVIAAVGLLFAIVFVRAGNKPVPASQPIAQPAAAPFSAYIAGAGIVEASTENIEVGATVSGVVTDVFVKVGDSVKEGDQLFKVDDRDLAAQLITSTAAVATAKAEVGVAEANLADLQNQFQMWDEIRNSDPRAVSKDEFDKRKFAAETGKATLEQAKARLAAAEAGVRATQTLIDRTIVRARIAGEVLQVKIRPGEFAQPGAAVPLMLLGRTTTLHVRVDVDENDAWRLKPNAPAVAFLRGNSSLSTPVKFVRVEPYVVPKRSLTGESTERVDTRVLQVLYEFDRNALPVYVGQQMDLFIEAPPVANGFTTKSANIESNPSL